jgi:hypothetical protein
MRHIASDDFASDARAERLETIQERSIAARRHGRGQVRAPVKLGANRGRRLSDDERRGVELQLRSEGRLPHVPE